MGRTYILAFGGCGANVMESLTMLLAAGAFSNREIVPLLIDIDLDNGNVRKCDHLMKQYRFINKSVYHEDCHVVDDNRNFFETRLITLSERRGAVTHHGDSWSMAIDHEEMRKALLRMRSINTPYPQNDIFMLSQSLFGQSIRQLGIPYFLKLATGIYGDISMTRLLYGIYGLWDDIRIKELMHIVCPGDKIVAVGSTFGCSGSSGMLELLKLYRKYDREFNNVDKAFVLLDPYFQIFDYPVCDFGQERYDKYTFKRRSDRFHMAYEGFEDVAKNTYHVVHRGETIMRKYKGAGAHQYDASSRTELLAAIAISHFVSSYNHVNDTYVCDLEEGNRADIQNLLSVTGLGQNISDMISCTLGYFSILAFCNEKYFFLENIINDHDLMHHFSLSGCEANIGRITEFTNYYVKWWTEIAENSCGQLDIFDFQAEKLNLIFKGRRLFGDTGFFMLWRSAYGTFWNEFRRSLMHNHETGSISGYERILSASRDAAVKITERPFGPINNNTTHNINTL